MANAKQRRKKSRASSNLRATSSPSRSPATASRPVVVPVVPALSNAASRTPTVETWPKIIGYAILAFVTFVGSIATAFQVAGVQNVPFAHLLLVLGWLGFVGSFFLLERVVLLPRPRMLKLTLTVALISGFIMLGMDRFMVYLKKSQADESAIVHHTPNPGVIAPTAYIRTRLVIDSVRKERVAFHLQVDNGELPIRDIRAAYSTNNFNVDPEVIAHDSFEITTFMPRILPPGGTLSIPGSISDTSVMFTRDGPTSLMVMIGYRAETSATTSKDFTAVYRFLIRSEDIKPQIIHPEGVETKEEEFNDRAMASKAAAKGFLLTKGMFSFNAGETRRNGEPNIVRDENEYRKFVFDPVNRLVSFQMKTSSGRVVTLELPLPERKDKRHRLSLGWDYSQGGYLAVDGIVTQNIKGKARTFSVPAQKPERE